MFEILENRQKFFLPDFWVVRVWRLSMDFLRFFKKYLNVFGGIPSNNPHWTIYWTFILIIYFYYTYRKILLQNRPNVTFWPNIWTICNSFNLPVDFFQCIHYSFLAKCFFCKITTWFFYIRYNFTNLRTVSNWKLNNQMMTV